MHRDGEGEVIDESKPDDLAAKSYEVGYGKPPVGTRFQKGQKPPPRKKKEIEAVSPRDVLWMILQEDRRVMVDGKPQWMRTAEIILNNAYLLADKGNATLQRLITELMMRSSGEDERDPMTPRLIFDPESTEPSGSAIVHHRVGS